MYLIIIIFRNYEKYFMQSLKVRRLISDDFKNIWKSNYDFLITPTTLTTAPLLSEFKSLDNRTQCATQDYCTQPANMAGKYNLYRYLYYIPDKSNLSDNPTAHSNGHKCIFMCV